MEGFQITFYTEQEFRHGHEAMGDWLLRFAKEHGANGGTVVSGTEGFGSDGKIRSAHLFELGEQPVEVTVSIDQAGADSLLAALAQEPVSLAYVKTPIEFGRVGKLA